MCTQTGSLTRRQRLFCALLSLVFPFGVGAEAGAGPAPGTKLDDSAALAVSQAAIGRTVGDHRLFDREGKPVSLAQFRGRPLVVSLVYTSCYHTCPVLTNHLEKVAEVAQDALGAESFSLVSIGFDTPNDTPQRMADFARARGVDLPGWRFLSGDRENVDALIREIGFVYFKSPKGFDHLAQVTVIDAEGKVYRQVYGEVFDPPLLVEPLKQLVYGIPAEAGTLAGWINNVRLFCTIYDPALGRYRFDYSVFFGLAGGILSLGLATVFVINLWRDPKPPRSAG